MTRPPKGAVADHWTWKDGVANVTGWHVPERRKAKAEVEAKPSGRGVVATSLFERMATAQRQEPSPVSKNTGPSKRVLRELDAPKRPARKPTKQQMDLL